ncbi:S8 family serine peptidase [Streptomyces sp. HPF1205]|uniref:S8 family serine peptidase n=1 Tax=Streptomyces sp. HPF1205 TaxID=2873262 RepID=UPI001CEDD728|nr:S8 family serine peptidase [Streptomyces sp. HPF1205]
MPRALARGPRPPARPARLAAVLLLTVACAAAAVPATAAPPPVRTPLDTAPAGQAPAPPRQRQGVVPGQVLVTLDADTAVTGAPLPGTRLSARTPHTSSPALDAALRAVGATSLRPLVARTDPAVSRSYVVQTREHDSASAALALQRAPGVAYAEPDRYVNTMNTGARPLPRAALAAYPRTAPRTAAADDGADNGAGDGAIPGNAALTTSSQALLNAGGVDAVGAFSLLQGRYGQQPGTGETITNVSIGDLTDQSMADAGDAYVQSNGPTTVLKDGQRYLDLPSMPLIPTYVAEDTGGLDGAAATENQDPALDEVLLDFGVMAPLAHDRQRPQATGSGWTDLLGIAPGADYRLVVPQQPTTDRIAGALLAAAHQSPRPDVITASLGFGTDAQGFPGRYLEDDPVIRAVVASIVREGVVVSISSNDGTRLYTPAPVGPDGGSTPTDLATDPRRTTTIDDDALSTTPSLVPDSGAIAAGGSTLDDTLAAGPGGDATTAETRISGFGSFSSGFGSRVDLSAPSDNVLAFSHSAGGGPQDVDVSLNGGTSASAPEIAAAAAVVLQSGRLGGHPLTPAQVRQILVRTGRAVPTPPQIDRELHVGPQIDVAAAARRALGDAPGTGGAPAIVRLAVAHRVTIGGLGGSFLEAGDPNRIDLGDRASGGTGEGLVGPVTFAADVTGLTGPARYTLTVGSTVFRSDSPAIRVTPTQLLTAAGLPVAATADRQVTVTYRVLTDGRTRAATTRTLTVGPSDGTYAEATAPRAPATVAAGRPVTVSYDLTGVAGTSSPQLVVSTAGHWNPTLAPLFTAAWHQELTAAKGTVTIPADAFTGGGLYGIGIAQSGFGGNPKNVVYGEFAPVRVVGGAASDRPAAPLLTGVDPVPGHTAEATRAASGFTLRYDVRQVPGARGAEVEFSSPAPTRFGSLNTFTNANGTRLDDDGVDSPSVLHRVLAGTSGSVRMDAAALGLTGSDLYGVRLLALDRDGRITGQASPVSSLAFDDGLAPGNATVSGFAAAGDHSVAALALPSGGSQVRHYATATGGYGAVITSDPVPGSDYEVVGATADRVLLAHRTAPGGDVRFETWDTATDTLVGTAAPAAGDTYVTGRVDTVHRRGDLLLRDAGKADQVLTVDLATGTAGEPIPADPAQTPAGTYGLLAVDSSTGQVFLAKQAGPFNCLGSVTVARVDPVARTVAPAGTASGCGHGLASDGSGSLYDLSATEISVNIVPTGVLGVLDEPTGTATGSVTVRLGKPSGLAVDGPHHIAVVSYPTPVGTPYFGAGMYVPDNNATGRLVVVDLTTGTVIRTLPGFSVGTHGGAENAIQLDPATRTGWTFGPDDAQIQQFSY